jgi:hypothetical protein
MSETDFTFNRPTTQDRRKTQLSIYSESNASWLFLDPTTITWTDYLDNISYYIPEEDIGILLIGKRDPSSFEVLVEAGELLYRDSSKEVHVYGRLSSLTELQSIFGETNL